MEKNNETNVVGSQRATPMRMTMEVSSRCGRERCTCSLRGTYKQKWQSWRRKDLWGAKNSLNGIIRHIRHGLDTRGGGWCSCGDVSELLWFSVLEWQRWQWVKLGRLRRWEEHPTSPIGSACFTTNWHYIWGVGEGRPWQRTKEETYNWLEKQRHMKQNHINRNLHSCHN